MSRIDQRNKVRVADGDTMSARDGNDISSFSYQSTIRTVMTSPSGPSVGLTASFRHSIPVRFL